MGVFISVTLTGRDELPIEKPFHLHGRVSNRPNLRLEMSLFSFINGQISKWCKEGWGCIFGSSFLLYLLLLLLALYMLKIDHFWLAFLPGVISKKKKDHLYDPVIVLKELYTVHFPSFLFDCCTNHKMQCYFS